MSADKTTRRCCPQGHLQVLGEHVSECVRVVECRVCADENQTFRLVLATDQEASEQFAHRGWKRDIRASTTDQTQTRFPENNCSPSRRVYSINGQEQNPEGDDKVHLVHVAQG